MAVPTKYTTRKSTAILAVFALAVVTSGIPRIEIHSHQNAFFGHTHGVSQHHGDHHYDGEFAEDGDGLSDTATLHAHDLGVSVVTLMYAATVTFVGHRPGNGGIPPPTAIPADNITAPLYRPPIV